MIIDVSCSCNDLTIYLFMLNHVDRGSSETNSFWHEHRELMWSDSFLRPEYVVPELYAVYICPRDI